MNGDHEVATSDFPQLRPQPLRAPGDRSSAKKTIVFILSTSYSGSHYLSLMLGSHSRAMHLGEIHRVRRGRVPLGDLCFTCRDQGFCPLFSDIGPNNVADVHKIVSSRIDPDTQVLIDTSKVAHGWADQFLGRDDFQHKYIHLIRDPRALVRRWLLKRASAITHVRRRWRILRSYPLRFWQAPFVSTPRALTYQWLELNRRISAFIARHDVDARVLTYRDLARNPAGEIEKLTEWIGLRHEPGQHEYWNFSHHGTQKAEYEWVKGQRSPHIDLRWQSELDEAAQERIWRNADVQFYLNELGLRMAEDGLTRAYDVSLRRVPLDDANVREPLAETTRSA
jgi:hypothetical protein